MVLALAFANLFKNFFDVGQTVHHGNLHLALFAKVNRAFLHPLLTAGRFIDDMSELLAGDDVVNSTNGCFHHTACYAEDGSGARVLRHEGAVEFAFGNLQQVNPVTAKHASKLTDGKHEIGVRHAIVLELTAGGFVLLGRAGHDRDKTQLVRIDAVFAGKPCLGERPEDRLRRARGREVRNDFRVHFFDKVHPTWATACHHRQRAAVVQTFEQFRALFHDGYVGCPVDVADVVGAELL